MGSVRGLESVGTVVCVGLQVVPLAWCVLVLACTICGARGCSNAVRCVCMCDAQFFQIMLKLRGSTMMRPNHEFLCSVALSPGFRN